MKNQLRCSIFPFTFPRRKERRNSEMHVAFSFSRKKEKRNSETRSFFLFSKQTKKKKSLRSLIKCNWTFLEGSLIPKPRSQAPGRAWERGYLEGAGKSNFVIVLFLCEKRGKGSMYVSAKPKSNMLSNMNYGIRSARSPNFEIPVQFPKIRSFGFWTTFTVFPK